jgi:hypothetical protein
MLEFILKYEVLSYIMLCIVFIFAFAILYRYRHLPIVRATLFAWVCEVEKELGNGAGIIQFDKVFSRFYYKMPLLVRIVFPQRVIARLIEEAYQRMKEYLRSGKDLNGRR